MSLSIYLSVCVYFEDVSQSPLKHSKCPRPLKIGLISKSRYIMASSVAGLSCKIHQSSSDL